MKLKTIIFFIVLSYQAISSFSQDSLTKRYKKVFPGIQLGWNRVGFSTWEGGFFLGLTNNKMKQTKVTSVTLHGPSLGCELGNYYNAFRAAPKFSYEIYTTFIGGRVSLVDYMNNDLHNLYISPEAGLTMSSMFNLFAGATFPVSKNQISEVKTFRLTISINLLLFYLGKGSAGKVQ